MKKNGFTLIELLVAITILGIITIMVLPSVRKVQSTNRLKRYESYTTALEKASKAYVDSFEEDFFPTSTSEGCATITYEELEDKKLIKDIKIKNLTCAKQNDTFVQVSKINKKYYYQVFLRCRDENNNIQYTSDYYENINHDDCITSEGKDTEPPIIDIIKAAKNNRARFKKEDLENENTLKIKIQLKDSIGGMTREPIAKVVWNFIGVDNTGQPANIGPIYSEYKFEKSQMASHNLVSDEIEIPKEFKGKDLNGKIYVHAESNTPGSIQDVYGNGKNQIIESKTIYFILDNLGPKVEVTMWKWKNNEEPSRETTGLDEYKENTWLSGKVLTKAEWEDVPPPGTTTDQIPVSEVDDETVTYTTTGETKNETNVKATFRNIEEEGKSFIEYTACDKVGNCTKTRKYKVLIDRTAPSCTSSGGSTTWSKERTLIGTCNDKNGDLDVSECKTKTVEKLYETTLKSTKESPGKVYDNAGNEGICPANQTVYIDHTPPTCTVGYTSPENYSGDWTNKDVKIYAKCNDAHSGCAEENSEITTYTTDMNEKVSPGVVRDKVGNVAVCPAIGQIRIDKTPPTCIWDPKTTRDRAFNTIASIDVYVTCEDSASGCVKERYDKILGYFMIDLRPYEEVNSKTTAGTIYDKAGNKTVCPKIRPYSDSNCIYSDNILRHYPQDSLRNNKFYVIQKLGYRPNGLTAIFSLINIYDGIGDIIHGDHLAGYRRYRKVGNEYVLCLDKSLDIMFDQTPVSDDYKIEQKYYADKEYPGIGPVSSIGG